MLTYPSDSLPQIVCPMDEHVITPNRFCSAPPHSEPPTPLLPLSSTTPSCAQNGISQHRRSGRLHEIRTPEKQSGAAQKASGLTPAPTERPGENPVSKSKQPRVEVTHVHEEQKQNGFKISFATEHQNTQKDQESPPNVSAEENVVEQFAVDTTKSDMDTCSGLALGHSFDHVSPPKGWVIGPLFQSFKSKMASFTEIVMSPAKLFRANSPPPRSDHPVKVQESELEADGASDVEHSEVLHAQEQRENGNQQRLHEEEDAQNEITVAFKYSKKLSFDEELPTHGSEQADDCAITSPDSVPLQRRPSASIDPEEGSEPGGSVGRSSTLPSVDASASHESMLKTSSAVEEQKSKLTLRQRPLPRKCTVNKSGVKKVTFKTSASKVTKQEGRNSVKPNKAVSVCHPDPDCPQPDGDDGDGRKIESLLPSSHLNNLNDSNGRTPMPSLDIQLLDCQLHPETYSAAGLGRAKRGVEVDYHPQDVVKRKRLAADECTKETQRHKVLNVASDVGMLRPSRRDVVLTNPVVEKPARKRLAVTTRANKNGKEMFATINEMVFSTHSESPSDAMSVYSLDQCSGVSESDVKGGSCQVKPSGPGRRLKTRTGLMKPDVNIENGMEVETRMEIASTEAAQLEPLSDALIRPAMKPLRQNTSQRRDTNKKPPKRKSPVQSGSTAESDGALFSTSSALSMEPLEPTPTGCNTSHKEEMKGLDQPSKRPKRSVRVLAKSSASGGSQDQPQSIQNLDLKAKENQPNEGQISVDPVYFEMTPFEMNEQPVPSPSHPNGDGLDVKRRESSPASVSDEVFPTDAEASVSVSGLRSSAGRVNTKPRRADSQRRKCRRFHSRTREGEEVTNSVTVGDADLAPASSPWSEKDLSRRLLRSYSCPEIPCLRPHDVPWTHSPHHSRVHALHQHQASHTPSLHQAHKALRRARRHTVSSVEVEREIAPLCLRKEVYPSRRSLPYDPASLSAGLALSPSASLSALASGFLSSPLAFLSKKVESRGAAASPGTSSHLPSPASSSSPMYPLIFLQRIDSSSAASLEYSNSGNLCEMERRRREEMDDGEDTSSSSHEFDDIALREEKALSDSEIKVVQKHEERGKVSSIRIRKTLPKPQNNLTPMGLPKAVRLKKKEFSLEEIYTNKNFSKPPESRLETIFEVPLNRRNGSESWFGLRRLKRFLEFLDAGEVRKPKKPLVGVGKAGVSSSRRRRGGFHRDKPALSVQEVDSLLCSKLDQLSLWLTIDQEDR